MSNIPTLNGFYNNILLLVLIPPVHLEISILKS